MAGPSEGMIAIYYVGMERRGRGSDRGNNGVTGNAAEVASASPESVSPLSDSPFSFREEYGGKGIHLYMLFQWDWKKGLYPSRGRKGADL